MVVMVVVEFEFFDGGDVWVGDVIGGGGGIGFLIFFVFVEFGF